MDDERIEHALKLGPVDEPAYKLGVQSRIAGSADDSLDAPSVASKPALQ